MPRVGWRAHCFNSRRTPARCVRSSLHFPSQARLQSWARRPSERRVRATGRLALHAKESALMVTLMWVIGFIVVLGGLAYFRAPGFAWLLVAAAFVAGVTLRGGSPAVNGTLWTVLVIFGALVLVRPLRRALLSDPLLHVFRKALPH